MNNQKRLQLNNQATSQEAKRYKLEKKLNFRLTYDDG